MPYLVMGLADSQTKNMGEALMSKVHVVTVLVSLAASVVLWSGCSTQSYQWNRPLIYNEEEYNTLPQAGRAGRTDVPRYTRVEAPAPAPKAAPAAKPAPTGSNCFTLKSDLLQLTKCVPAAATLGETVENTLTVVALANCANAVVTDTIPDGATYVRSEPSATLEGRKLVWTFDALDKGSTTTIKVWYKADREGTLVNCATMAAIPRGCAATVVGRATLAIDKSGPATANIGQQIPYTVVVKNTGSAVARNVVVTDTVPDGLSSASGQKVLTFNVGDLAPGQSRDISVPLKADRRGRFCNVAAASASNAAEVKDEACTTVLQPGLAISKEGTKEQFLGRTATYTIVVSNTGDTDLKDVVVTDTAPAATRIVKADGASISGNTATWRMATLAKGAKENLSIVLTSTTPGSHCNDVTVRSAEGLSAKDQACTLWKGIPAVLIEVVDDPDPIAVGESTTYTIRVTNQGTAEDKNIKLVANFGKEIDPVSGSGSTTVTVSGKSVDFGNVATLAPKQTVTWTLRAKGVVAGDHRLKVRMTSDMLTSPVTEEESTHVY